MGLTTGAFPPVDPATFMQTPYRERTKILTRHWAEYGFGAPKITAVVYIAKLLLFYMLGGVLVATLTSDLHPLHPSAWWDEPIVYQKLVLWTVLLECVGVAGSTGEPGGDGASRPMPVLIECGGVGGSGSGRSRRADAVPLDQCRVQRYVAAGVEARTGGGSTRAVRREADHGGDRHGLTSPPT